MSRFWSHTTSVNERAGLIYLRLVRLRHGDLLVHSRDIPLTEAAMARGGMRKMLALTWRAMRLEMRSWA